MILLPFRQAPVEKPERRVLVPMAGRSACALMPPVAEGLFHDAAASVASLAWLQRPRLCFQVSDTSLFRFVSDHRPESSERCVQHLSIQPGFLPHTFPGLFPAAPGRSRHPFRLQLLRDQQSAASHHRGALLVQEILPDVRHLGVHPGEQLVLLAQPLGNAKSLPFPVLADRRLHLAGDRPPELPELLKRLAQMARIGDLGNVRLALSRLQPGAGQEPLRAQVESLGSTAMLPRRPAAHRDRRMPSAAGKKDLACPGFSGSTGLAPDRDLPNAGETKLQVSASLSGDQLPVTFVLLEAETADSPCLLETRASRLFALPDAAEERLKGEIQPLERYLGGLSVDRGEKRAAGTEFGEPSALLDETDAPLFLLPRPPALLQS